MVPIANNNDTKIKTSKKLIQFITTGNGNKLSTLHSIYQIKLLTSNIEIIHKYIEGKVHMSEELNIDQVIHRLLQSNTKDIKLKESEIRTLCIRAR